MPEGEARICFTHSGGKGAAPWIWKGSSCLERGHHHCRGCTGTSARRSPGECSGRRSPDVAWAAGLKGVGTQRQKRPRCGDGRDFGVASKLGRTRVAGGQKEQRRVWDEHWVERVSVQEALASQAPSQPQYVPWELPGHPTTAPCRFSKAAAGPSPAPSQPKKSCRFACDR